MVESAATVLGRRVLAVVLPDLLEELAARAPLTAGPSGAVPTAPGAVPTAPGAVPTAPGAVPTAPGAVPTAPGDSVARAGRRPRVGPRAIVLSDLQSGALEPHTRIDAVNAAARARGITPRMTIAQATAVLEPLAIQALPRARVTRALQQVAESALGFGSPVSFELPDTVWVDVSGSRQLFGGERELALTLRAHVRALGHAARVSGAPGPWLAQSFARHADFDETGVYLVDEAEAAACAGLLPISALPITSDAVAWFARLGLLTLEDLRRLPRAALASRLEGARVERLLELIHGRDAEVLEAFVPEALPCEEQGWDYPLESVEPMLFVLKGLCARLGSRLEGRGQAAQELLLTIEYDRALAALRRRERRERGGAALREPLGRSAPGRGTAGAVGGIIQGDRPDGNGPDGNGPDSDRLDSDRLDIPFRLASPLGHADDLERIVRSRLQKVALLAPAIGLRLRVTALTEAQQWQQTLNVEGGLGASLSDDPRTLAVLVAELSADLGSGAVGKLEARDSHLLEKSSGFVPLQLAAAGHGSPARAVEVRAAEAARPPAELEAASPPPAGAVPRLPTRLVAPIELEAPLEKNGIVVLEQRAYVIESIRFEERLEAVEWWAASPISRDYFRLWLAALGAPAWGTAVMRPAPASRGRAAGGLSRAPFRGSPHEASARTARHERRGDGLEVLVYLDRNDGKKYVQALYD